MNFRLFRLLMLCPLLTLVAGCVLTPPGPPRQVYQINVNALADSNAERATTFVIIPATKDIAPDDLQFIAYARQLEKVMNEKGYQRVASDETADMALALTYGISDPKTKTSTYAQPVFGVTGVSSSRTTGDYSGTVNRYGNSAFLSGYYSQTTTYTPTYGVTGYTQHTVENTVYTRHLSIHAIDCRVFRKANKIARLWQITMTSTGASGDLRQVFPYMLVAGMDHYGNTSEKLHEIDGEDSRVSWLRR